jgi:molybdate transport system substrate-binding protein
LFGSGSLVLLLALSLALGLASAAHAQEILVSAAISLKEAAEELGRELQRTHPGVSVRFNFGASGDLQKQIEGGAPVDLFLSAGQRQMDALEQRRLLLPGSQRLVARNALTLIAPEVSRLELRAVTDLTRVEVQRVVLGNPKTVPAGQYAEECLRSLGLWDTLRPKYIFAENVRQVLEYVARGEVDAGFVYTTDLLSRPGAVKEVARPPQSSYSPITYPGAVIGASTQKALALAFMDLVMSGSGQQVLARYGFQPPGGTGR